MRRLFALSWPRRGPRLGLCFYDADSAAIHEEYIVGRANLGRVFADVDALVDIQGDLVFVLNLPPRLGQLCIDLIACNLFVATGSS